MLLSSHFRSVYSQYNSMGYGKLDWLKFIRQSIVLEFPVIGFLVNGEQNI